MTRKYLPRIKSSNGHKHQWQRGTKRSNGVTFLVHVCMDHRDEQGKPKPLLMAYDMTTEVMR